ncbi:PREDICTED: uncharacterized oxidoreductase YjmC-like [Priapulus caudatus]|uniref:Uncharacterized oxidoreductase YjmC-like n=1 Tax=Priapulus caudatus TaxID=37621 RepID=A0ABM1F891_PRICU|nr:PREDICTED: uncharacterized oxidoreductase YjmC-like [Priapulus caudatus]
MFAAVCRVVTATVSAGATYSVTHSHKVAPACSTFACLRLKSPERHYNNYCHSRRMSSAEAPQGVVVELDEVKQYMVRCMTKVGTKQAHAEALADVLLAADHRGHYSHGLNRLDMYVHDIRSKICRSDIEPSIIKETAATAYVNGNNVLGPVVGNFCTDLAIKKAKEAGIGWVVAKGSNHFGIAGWYSMRASDQGFLGMAFTDTSPLVVPTRARKPVLGTNPITLAAPAAEGDSFVLDMATSTCAVGKIELQHRKGLPIPNGWGVDSEGKEVNDPEKVLGSKGGLLPLGGTEISSGYKGYGLGMMVEVFCGILAGSAYGPNIRKWMNTTTEADLGQCFVAIDPDAFAPGFPDRMSDLMNICRTSQPIEGETEVLVAGDPERKHMEKCKNQGGVDYHPNQIAHMYELAKQLDVAPMNIKN